MKIRLSHVTNSSSSSFVICKKDLINDNKKWAINYIETNFCNIDSKDLLEDCRSCDLDYIYYLVDYKPEDEEMHIWVRRDESMYDDAIDDILWDYDRYSEIPAKFDYHY